MRPKIDGQFSDQSMHSAAVRYGSNLPLRTPMLAGARGLAVQQVARANDKRFDSVLARIAGARAATCAEAMPAMNLMLESVR